MADEEMMTLKYGVYMRGPVDGVVSDEPIARFQDADAARQWASRYADWTHDQAERYVVLSIVPSEPADETTVTTGEAESFITHMRKKVQRSQETWPDDWRYRFTFYDGEVANLLDDVSAAQASEPRAIIQHFAAAMERKLAANDHKGGWRDAAPYVLLESLREEVRELHMAMELLTYRQACNRQAPADVQAVLFECVDVALYAMMVADRYGALPPTDERGR